MPSYEIFSRDGEAMYVTKDRLDAQRYFNQWTGTGYIIETVVTRRIVAIKPEIVDEAAKQEAQAEAEFGHPVAR